MARMVIGLVVLFSLLAGCAAQPASPPQQIQAALNKNVGPVDQYILGPSDVVQVSVWRNQDLSVSVPVRPDGRISVPLVGDVVAAGLTPEELADNVQDKLNQYIRQPQVSVVVTGMNSHEFTDRVRVTGAVENPMSMPFRDGMTVMDVVLSAGGANPFAALNESRLYRPMGKDVVAIPVRLDDILSRGDISTNYRMLPGDILTIPERNF